jgi:hypothetical protein
MSERRPVHKNMRLVRLLLSDEVVNDAITISRVWGEDVHETHRRLYSLGVAAEVQSPEFKAKLEERKQEREAATGEPVTEEQATAARMLIRAVSEDEK